MGWAGLWGARDEPCSDIAWAQTDSPRGAEIGSWAVGRVWGESGSVRPISAFKALTQHTQLRCADFSGGSAYLLVWKITEPVCFFFLGPFIQIED